MALRGVRKALKRLYSGFGLYYITRNEARKGLKNHIPARRMETMETKEGL